MNNDKEFLATEPIGKLLLRLAIPTLAAQMINMLYNIIDRIYIGHIPESGALALTGVGVCMPLIMIISAFAALVGNGGAPRASILMGKKDLDSAENILGNCFSMQIIISVCFNSSLLKYGGDVAVGAMTILTSVMQFAMLPLQGLGQGAQPIMSYNYGAKNADRVKGTFFLLLKASLTYSVILWGLVMLFPQAFAGIFTSNPALVMFTKNALRVYMAEPVADFLAVTFTAILFSVQFKKALSAIRN